MMDSLVNNLRLNGIIIVVELRAFVYVAINLLSIAMVMLLTALLVDVIVVICGSCLWLCHIMCFTTIQKKTKQTLMENIAQYGI